MTKNFIFKTVEKITEMTQQHETRYEFKKTLSPFLKCLIYFLTYNLPKKDHRAIYSIIQSPT